MPRGCGGSFTQVHNVQRKYRLVIEVSTRNITLDAAFFEQCNSTVNNKAAFEEVVFTQNSPVGTITHMTPG